MKQDELIEILENCYLGNSIDKEIITFNSGNYVCPVERDNKLYFIMFNKETEYNFGEITPENYETLAADFLNFVEKNNLVCWPNWEFVYESKSVSFDSLYNKIITELKNK